MLQISDLLIALVVIYRYSLIGNELLEVLGVLPESGGK